MKSQVCWCCDCCERPELEGGGSNLTRNGGWGVNNSSEENRGFNLWKRYAGKLDGRVSVIRKTNYQ